MFKTDILFTGFYGQANTGDDAFVEVASWGAKKYWGKDNNRFFAKKNRLPSTVVPVKGYPFSIDKTYDLQADILMRNTAAMIFAGGSTIHSKLSYSNIRMKALKHKLAGGALKIGGIGVSIGPFKSNEDESAVQAYLKKMDFLAVRDQKSFDYVSQLDLPYTPINAFDLAALLPDIYGKRKKPEKDQKVIGISLCPYESVQVGLDITNEIRRNNMLIDLIKKLDKIGDVHFQFYVINGNEKIGDRKLTTETIQKVSPKSFELIEYSKLTRTIWESIADCDFMISTRLHAAIFACFAEIPFMLNEYHRKCTDFLDTIEYSDKYRLFDSEYDIEEKAYQIMDIINDRTCYIFPKKKNEMETRAKLNFTEISL